MLRLAPCLRITSSLWGTGRLPFVSPSLACPARAPPPVNRLSQKSNTGPRHVQINAVRIPVAAANARGKKLGRCICTGYSELPFALEQKEATHNKPHAHGSPSSCCMGVAWKPGRRASHPGCKHHLPASLAGRLAAPGLLGMLSTLFPVCCFGASIPVDPKLQPVSGPTFPASSFTSWSDVASLLWLLSPLCSANNPAGWTVNPVLLCVSSALFPVSSFRALFSSVSVLLPLSASSFPSCASFPGRVVLLRVPGSLFPASSCTPAFPDAPVLHGVPASSVLAGITFPVGSVLFVLHQASTQLPSVRAVELSSAAG